MAQYEADGMTRIGTLVIAPNAGIAREAHAFRVDCLRLKMYRLNRSCRRQ